MDVDDLVGINFFSVFAHPTFQILKLVHFLLIIDHLLEVTHELCLELSEVLVRWLLGQVLNPHREVSDLYEGRVHLFPLVRDGPIQPASVQDPDEADQCVASNHDISEVAASHRPKVNSVNGRDVTVVLQEELKLVRFCHVCDRGAILNVVLPLGYDPLDLAELLIQAVERVNALVNFTCRHRTVRIVHIVVRFSAFG